MSPHPRGRVEMHEFTSRVLVGNAAGDPHVRRVPVYLPPSYDTAGTQRYPVVFLLTGFGSRGRGLLNDNPWSPSIDDRLDALIANGCPELIAVMPDAFTRFGGSQYMDSAATGAYETHLIEELVPWADATFRTRGDRAHRGIAGKSSGGFGALRLGMRHPDVFAALACHSGDLLFEYCYAVDFPRALSTLQEAGGVARFLERFASSPQKGKDDFLTLNIVGMASCYSPDPAAELGIGLPFDLATGRPRPEVFERWLAHDPLRLLPTHADALRAMKLVYLDCGTRDEFHLHHGARAFVSELERLGIAHEYEEFKDGHMNVSYRYDTSLPRLARALCMSAPAPLVVEHLARRFGALEAVSDLSLRVEPGTIVGFLGANGAGKTTTLRCIAGLLTPDAGNVSIAGASLAHEPRVAKARMGFVPDRPFLYERLSAREFLAFMAALHDLPADAAERRAEQLLERLELREHASRTIEGYSLGMRQKTAIAAALLHSPPLLLLDEPLNGLDPGSTRVLKELLREHAAAGGGVLVSTHLLDVAERLCDTLVIVRRGRVVAAGTLAELRGADSARTLEAVFMELEGSSGHGAGGA